MKKLTNKGFVGIGLVLLALVLAGLLFVRHENAALARQYKIVRCSAKAGTKISGKQIEIERYVEKVEPKKVYFKLIVNSQKAQSLENLQLVNTPDGTVDYFDSYKVNGKASEGLRLKPGRNVIEGKINKEDFGKKGVKTVLWYKLGKMKYAEYFFE